MTPIEKAEAIVQIFETGKFSTGGYSTVAILADGAGISYGKHQATDKSGSLDTIMKQYILQGGTYASEIQKYIYLVEKNQTIVPSPARDELVTLLKKAGNDPIMQKCQDETFRLLYMAPALQKQSDLGLKSDLSLAVLYDTCIHSGPAGVERMRALFPAMPPSKGGDEKVWLTQYCQTRRAWLANSKNPVVQKTVYRPDAFLKLIFSNQLDLILPFYVRGQRIA